MFGEDALANLSVEKTPEGARRVCGSRCWLADSAQGSIVGTVRIRAKTHGIAVSLGDKISSAQNAQK